MMRMAAGITYCGRAYYGWQRQRDQKETVQEMLETAFSFVANHAVRIHCAGRTDRGVHAVGQVIHFDTNVTRRLDQWLLGVNAKLPSDIRIQWVCSVPDAFHARFSALSRSYRYVIDLDPNASAVFDRHAYAYRWPLDHEAMHQAMQHWIGKHDFSSFRSAMCSAKHPVRVIEKASVRLMESFLVIDITANAFLHHMVRNMIGALVVVGQGKKDTVWAKTLLEEKNRDLGPKMAPACGLYLMTVQYPHDLPKHHVSPWLRFF